MKKLFRLLIIITMLITLAPMQSASAAIKINKKSAVVINGDYLNLKITGTKKKVTWSSSNKYVATVSKKGKVTTKSEGKTNITAKVDGKKYTCKVVVIPNLDPDYMTDRDVERALAERDYIDKPASNNLQITTTPTPTPTPAPNESTYTTMEIINLMKKYGFASSEELNSQLGKAYIEFCSTWVSEHELKNTNDISVVWDWPDNEIYLILDAENKYIIKNVPDKFTSGEVYTNDEVQYQYLEKFEYNEKSYTKNEFYFDRENLISKGIISK